MKVIGQSVVKAENDIFVNNIERHNEDAWCYKENVVAVADGAGGTGLFADKWAEKLVKSVPVESFGNTENIEDWISSFWEDFYNKHIDEVKTDVWKLKKFETEGSAATLSVLWYIGDTQYIYESYGDTALFVYNKETGELKIQENLQLINSFTGNPPLLNWRDEKVSQEFFFRKEIKLAPDERIIIATDGIAMYIYGAYMVYKGLVFSEIQETKMRKIIDYFVQNPIINFKEWMEQFKKVLLSPELFKKLTDDLYRIRALPNDDYTLIWIA